MENDFSLQSALNSVWTSLAEAVAGFLPLALTALAVFLVGLDPGQDRLQGHPHVFEKFRLNESAGTGWPDREP